MSVLLLFLLLIFELIQQAALMNFKLFLKIEVLNNLKNKLFISYLVCFFYLKIL